jgi:hypothetical protein
MSAEIRSRDRPFYARALGLRYLRPNGLLCFFFFEGAIALATLLALAELVTWWAVVVLPGAIAVMVKINDVIAGVGVRAVARAEARAAVRAAARQAARHQARPAETPAPHQLERAVEEDGIGPVAGRESVPRPYAGLGARRRQSAAHRYDSA